MKITESAFYSFKQFGYLLLHNGGNGDLVQLFPLFFMFLNDKAFKAQKPQVIKLKNHSSFLTISGNFSYVPRHRKRQ